MLALTGALASSVPAAAADVETLRAEAQAVADRVSDLEGDLASLERRAARLEDQIDLSSVSLAQLELELDAVEDRLAITQDAYIQRAIEAYKFGTSTQMAMLLATENLSDLADVAEITSRAATLDQNTVAELQERRAELAAAQQQVDSRKQFLLEARRAAEVVAVQMQATLSERRAELRDMNARIEELVAQARRAAEAAAAARGTSVDQALIDILAPSGPSQGIPDGFVSTGVSFEGLASWYGPGFEGNLTANGDVFDSSLYTAASKELPLGSWLYVEHAGAGAVVYVNDRGPYVGERILDLSKAAAEAIGLIGPGVAWVRAEILTP